MNLGVIFSVLSLLSMSVAPILNKFASAHLSWAWSAALSSLFCFAICVVAQPNKVLSALRSKRILSPTLFGIALTNSLGLICQFGAVVRLDPPTLSILGRMYIVFAIALSQLFLKERCTRLEKITLGLVLSGALVFCWSPTLSTDWIGLVLCLCYCFFFAVTHMQVKIETVRTPANVILFANNFLSAAVLLPIAYLFSGALPASKPEGILLILGSSFFGQWLGLLLFYESLKRISLVRANFIRTFSPIAGVIVAWPFFPVEFTRYQFIGAGILMAAVGLQALAKLKTAVPVRASPSIRFERKLN